MDRAAASDGEAGRGIPILMYHHIAPAPPRGTRSRYLFVHPDRFRRQMKALKLLGYRGCSIADLQPYLAGTTRGRVVGITFDDGYRDVHAHALPVLAELGFTSTTYFVSREVGGYNSWDEGYLPRDPCMSPAELGEWAAAGQEVGAHTRTHALLAALSEDAARAEIAGSRRELEDIAGRPVTAFSYPFGSHDERVVEIARESGFTSATTTESRRARGGDDPLRLPRLTVRRGDWLPGCLLRRVL